MFFLEEKVPCVVKMPYSYDRRALGTLHSERWKQRYACEEKEPLQDLMKRLSGEYRIVSNTGDSEGRTTP